MAHSRLGEKRQLAEGERGEGDGAKSWDGEKAWSSVTHLNTLCCQYILLSTDEGTNYVKLNLPMVNLMAI